MPMTPIVVPAHPITMTGADVDICIRANGGACGRADRGADGRTFTAVGCRAANGRAGASTNKRAANGVLRARVYRG
jgi:hypothetical protein